MSINITKGKKQLNSYFTRSKGILHWCCFVIGIGTIFLLIFAIVSKTTCTKSQVKLYKSCQVQEILDSLVLPS